GGHTKPSNLTMLCKYHNGVNNDDPDGQRNKRRPGKPKRGKPNRGRMRRHRGKVRLQTPGGKLVANTHHVSSMGAMNLDRKSTRLNSSHVSISYAVFCLKKKR